MCQAWSDVARSKELLANHSFKELPSMIVMTTDADDKSLKSFAKEETLIATNDCLRRADAASEQEQSTSTWQGGELLEAIGNYLETIANNIGK